MIVKSALPLPNKQNRTFRIVYSYQTTFLEFYMESYIVFHCLQLSNKIFINMQHAFVVQIFVCQLT